MAQVAVIRKPCSASLATPAWLSPSNSTKEMSCLPGTNRTSLKPGNLRSTERISCGAPAEEPRSRFWFWRDSLVEEHGQHHLVGLLGEVGQEQDVVRRIVRNLRMKQNLWSHPNAPEPPSVWTITEPRIRRPEHVHRRSYNPSSLTSPFNTASDDLKSFCDSVNLTHFMNSPGPNSKPWGPPQ